MKGNALSPLMGMLKPLAKKYVSEENINRIFDGITSEAADMLGVSDRIGRIAEGLDADLVLFPSDVLDIMQDPVCVMIDGRMV